jgi:NADPH:quinone reductase-like Zn-dependent oxidoreductase
MGTVVQVGPKVTKSFKPGDRVAGFTHGVNAVEKEDGCFAQYAVAKGDVQCKLPDNLSDEDAATLGVGVTTVGQGLYQSLGLPLPGSGQKADYPLLVYGGSTATGSLAIQFAVLSGAKVVTTCSPRNFPFVKALGAAEAFNYNDPDCAKKIREYTGDKLTKVFDCISEGDSPKISSEAISSKGGVVSYLLNPKHDRTDVENKVSIPFVDQPELHPLTFLAQATLGYTITGEAFKFFGGMDVPAKPQDFEFGKTFWELATKLLASQQLTVHPTKVGSGGLEGVLKGLDELREGKVSGVKLVYKIDESV